MSDVTTHPAPHQRRLISLGLVGVLLVGAALGLTACSTSPPVTGTVTLVPTSAGQVGNVIGFEAVHPAARLQLRLTSGTGLAVVVQPYGLTGKRMYVSQREGFPTLVDAGPSSPWVTVANIYQEPLAGQPPLREVVRLTAAAGADVALSFEARAVDDHGFPAGSVSSISPYGDDCGLVHAHTDLTAIDLTGRDLHACQLPGVTLDPAKLTGANLTGAELSQATIVPGRLDRTELATAVLADATLAGVDLTAAVLNDADLQRAHLDGADVHGVSLQGTNLDGTDLRRANLDRVSSGLVAGTPSLPSGWLVRGGYLIHKTADLTGAFLERLDLSNLDLAGGHLRGADLQSSDLHGTDLTGADLAGAALTTYPQFAGVDLEGTKLAGAVLTGVRSGGITGTPASLPTGWSLTNGFLLGPGASLISADLSGLDLHGRDLSGVTLDYSNLSGTDLRQTSLANALVTSSDLRGAQLDGTNLAGARLLEAFDLGPTDLTGATGTPLYAGADVSGARCPDGTLASAHGNTCQGHPWP